jgi:hypothetical protein
MLCDVRLFGVVAPWPGPIAAAASARPFPFWLLWGLAGVARPTAVRAKALVEEVVCIRLLLIPRLASHGAWLAACFCCPKVSLAFFLALLARSALLLGVLQFFQPKQSLQQPLPQLLQEFLQFLEQLMELIPPFNRVSTK